MSCDTTNALREKERGHYPTILTEQAFNHMANEIFFLRG